MKTRVSLKYIVNDCLWKQYFAPNLPHTPSSLISLTNLVTLSHFTLSKLKLEQSSCKKVLKFALLCNCFSKFFTEAKIGIKRHSCSFLYVF